MTILRKTPSIILFGLLLVVITALTLSKNDAQKGETTGIILDELGNEVLLAMKNNAPNYFFCDIFTPVCETGECKPIYINLYWDLDGNYLRFDFPEGEILTKQDHVPFTEDDYLLLDEILRGEDPRTGMAEVQHSTPKPDEESQSPSVPQRQVLLKIAMIDGITGSTLPEYKDKFVPGALYTTYTIWDLANTHGTVMAEYAQSLKKSQHD